MKYGWRIKYDVTGMVERVEEKKERERKKNLEKIKKNANVYEAIS